MSRWLPPVWRVALWKLTGRRMPQDAVPQVWHCFAAGGYARLLRGSGSVRVPGHQRQPGMTHPVLRMADFLLI